MKNLKISLTFIALLFLFNCNLLNKLANFNITQSTTFSIPPNSIINLPISLPSPDITTNSSQTFSSNKTNADLINTVKLKEMKLTITNPTTENFSFLKDIQIYINADSLSELLIAEKLNVTDTTNILNLDTKGDDLKAYLKKDKIRIRTQVTTDKVTTQTIDSKIDATFLVNAKIF